MPEAEERRHQTARFGLGDMQAKYADVMPTERAMALLDGLIPTASAPVGKIARS